MRPARLGMLAVVLAAPATASGPAPRAAPGPAARTAPAEPELARVQLAPGTRLLSALACDLDGRAPSDLVLALDEGGGRRALVVYPRAGGRAFAGTPAARLVVTPDVVAFAAADVHADAGAEVVLLTGRGAYAWRPSTRGEGALVRLCEADVLWQVPDGAELFAWEHALHDLDGDGLADLVLPEPDGVRVAFQTRDADGARFERVQRLDLPRTAGAGPLYAGQDPDELERRSSQGLALELGGQQGEDGGERRGPLVAIADALPAPRVGDFDGDGDLDVLALTTRSLAVWIQEPRGAFTAAPAHVLASPVERDLSRMLDVSYSAHAVELDGDGRIDCVMFARDTRAKEVRTQGLCFLHGGDEGALAPFGERGVPERLFVLAGFVTVPHFADLDGDGHIDLYTTVVRPDLIDAVRAAASERIDVDLVVFLNDGTGYARRPSLQQKLSLSATAGAQLVRFAGDLTGDGLADLLVRRDAERLELLPLVRMRDGLALARQPTWGIDLDREARVRPVSVGGVPEVLVLEGEEVLCVSFR
jgi:hypothetical protein